VFAYPEIFRIYEAFDYDLDRLLQEKNFYFDKIVLVTGLSYSADIGSRFISSSIKEHVKIDKATFNELERVKSFIKIHRVNLILGVGGGSVIDIVKRLSYELNIPTIVMPTLISNDGLISPIAVITTREGNKDSLPAKMPIGVIIDLQIINSSPSINIISAAGDILSNLSATNDWLIAYNKIGERINDFAFHLSRHAAKTLIYFEHKDKSRFKDFIYHLVTGQIHSGVAMAIAGTSRPCSGSEHLFSHALDKLQMSNLPHGYQVGVISLFTLLLQKDFRSEYLGYISELGLVCKQTRFYLLDEYEFKLVLNTAKIVRKDRYTILSEMNDNEIVEKYFAFKEVVL
jgi:glycerol-1-phosphate dehydrogenase [NAD(P)+]